MTEKKAANPLMIRFFNVWHIESDGVPLHISSRKQVALLAYLALERAQQHSRASLLGLLWPEMREGEARNNLRVALARLRRTLPGAVIGSNRHAVWLEAEQVWLDVAEVERLLAACASHTHDSRSTCHACQQRLAEAAMLYGGELLHGFHLDDCPAFSEWLMLRREQHHLQMMDILGELADFQAGQGAYETAVSYRRRQLKLNPFHEEAQRQLMGLLAQQGQSQVALTQFESYHQLLHQELGVTPSEETLAVVEMLQTGQFQKELQPPAVPSKVVAKEGEGKTAVVDLKHSLPHYLTPFAGREWEREQIRQRLTERSYRLITLVGPGGMGKTRLATQIARENDDLFADGVGFVSLAPIQSVDAVPAAIAQVLNISFESSVQGGGQQLVDNLREKDLLLVLDNLEHLLDIIDLILNILNNCPKVMILVTSRERLNYHAEDLFQLEGLPLPKTAERASAAIELFVDRAQRLDKGFVLTAENLPAIVRICQQVDGMPLGIELAAAWVEDFKCDEIAEAIGENLDFLTADYQDMATRHQSLRAVFDHSWQLLTPQEQMVLAKLSVFRGSFTLKLAMKVVGAAPQTSRRLRNKSLLRTVGGKRFDLHELIRQFAAEKLEGLADEKTAVRQKHSDAFFALLQRQLPRLQSSQQADALTEIEQDYENVLMAWEWALAQQNIAQLAHMRDVVQLFHLKRNRYEEGLAFCKRNLAARRETADLQTQSHYAMLRAWQGVFTNQLGNHELAQVLLRQAWEQIDRTAPEALLDRAFILYQTGRAHFQSDLQQARSYYEQSLNIYGMLDAPWQMANVLEALASAEFDLGNTNRADQLGEQNLAIRRQLDVPSEIASAYNTLIYMKLALRQFDLAERYAQEAIDICRQLNARRSTAEGLAKLCLTYLWSGKLALSPPLIQECIALYASLGAKQEEAFQHTRHSLYLLHLGRYDEAEAIAQTTLPMAQTLRNDRVTAWSIQQLACTAMGRGQYAMAQPLLRQAGSLFETRGNENGAAIVKIYEGFVLFHLEQQHAARQHWFSLLPAILEGNHYVRLLFTLTGLALTLAKQGLLEEAVTVYTRAESEPLIRQSQWYTDIAGQHLWQLAASLSMARFQAAQERGKTADLWELGRQVLGYGEATQSHL